MIDWCTIQTFVDGRNPAPVDIQNIPWFLGFHVMYNLQCRISSINNIICCWLVKQLCTFYLFKAVASSVPAGIISQLHQKHQGLDLHLFVLCIMDCNDGTCPCKCSCIVLCSTDGSMDTLHGTSISQPWEKQNHRLKSAGWYGICWRPRDSLSIN